MPLRTTASLSIVLFCAVGDLRAAERASVLSVPAGEQSLQVVVDAPEGWQPSRDAASFSLIEIGAAEASIPAQLIVATTKGEPHRLAAVIPSRAGAQGRRRFRLAPSAKPAVDAFRFKAIGETSLGLWESDAAVLVYNQGEITQESIPEKNHRRTRGSYIHPLYGLRGEVLTDDFPKDHYHHHGVFWTWPHIHVGEKEYDLWAGPGIKDRFIKWRSRSVGPVAGVIELENAWVVGEQHEKIMDERVRIAAFRSVGETRAVDVSLTLVPAVELTLRGAPGKSYGGFSVRFHKHDETVITTPTGKADGDLTVTKLPWCDFTDRFDGKQTSGAAIFVAADHPDYPPTWMTRYYGLIAVGWPGVEGKSFPAGKPIHLSYRVWIHDGPADAKRTEMAYRAYLAGADAKWEGSEGK